MKAKTLIHNARIYTQAEGDGRDGRLCVDSMAIYKNRIVAVGNRLQHDPDFEKYDKIDMRKKTVIPGLVDAHTHFLFFAESLGLVSLQGATSIETCLKRIKKFAATLKKNEWVVGEGYQPDHFKVRVEPDRYMLDEVTGGRPAFIFSKDQHSVWVNSRTLEIAGIDKKWKDPAGGLTVRLEDGTPTGILREGPAYVPILNHIPEPSKAKLNRLYKKALEFAYKRGVTGVHSFDGPDAFSFYEELAEKGKIGLRLNYYPGFVMLPALTKTKTHYNTGTEFFRLAGIKIFADGSLGSQSGLCFNKYVGSKDNYGIEVATVPQLKKLAKQAAKLGFPCAIHAIGDKAISNVLDAFESIPAPKNGVRHRIEHLQMIRRKDIARVKKLGVVASMQPSHCPSDIELCRKYWGKRSANAYVFRTLLNKKVDLAFGSDAPIEPLDPLRGIADAVRRARKGSRDIFYPKQRITASEALFAYTVGAAIASGESHCRGYLLPGYPADFAVLDRDVTKVAPTKLYDTRVHATVLDGQIKYSDGSLNI